MVYLLERKIHAIVHAGIGAAKAVPFEKVLRPTCIPLHSVERRNVDLTQAPAPHSLSAPTGRAMPVSYDDPVSADLLIEFIAWLGYTPNTEPGQAVILAIQGCTAENGVLTLNDNAMDVFNDTILLLEAQENGEIRARAWQGTIDPGRQRAGADVPSAGLAHITFGMHEYVKGFHHHNPEKSAFRARNERNRVWRDRAQDGKFTDGDVVEEGAFGVNIHAGGRSIDHIGDYSQGCINIFGGGQDPWTSPSWTGFRDAAYRHLTTPGAFIQVCVWRFRDLENWTQDPFNYRPMLVPGVKGPWVARMQQALKARGYPVKVDGDWMSGTTQILRKFQDEHGLTADAICGKNTWTALED